MALYGQNVKKTRAEWWAQVVAVFAVALLVSFVSGSVFLAPKASNAETDGSSVSVNVATTLAISTDATDGILSIPLIPTSTGTEAIGVLNVDVSTNNLTGYTLSVSSSTNTTDLVHTADTTAIIPTTTATTTAPVALTTNQWGYSNWTDTQIANSTAPTTYYRVPGTTSDTIRTTAEPLAHSVSRLSFAARADTAIPAGTYAHTLSFTATSNYVAPFIPAMQDFTMEQCSVLSAGETVQLRDSRDDKVYRVRKMADERCWMVDNLAYDLANASAPAYSPSAVLVSGATASVKSQAQYAQNTTAYDIPNNGNPTSSYYYNWCAAMGDTSANCATTVGYGAGQPATPQTGICPAPFRLPIGGAAPATPGNGTNQATAAATTTNEFAKLDIWMGGTGANRGSANTYTNFTTDNATNPQLFWLGVLGGNYYSGLFNQGSNGYWWSSTAYSGLLAYDLYLGSSSTFVGPSGNGDKGYGFAVRCIL